MDKYSLEGNVSVLDRVAMEESRRPFFRVYYNDVYEVPLPPRHRFPMKKYGQVRRQVQQWIAELPQEEQDLVNCGRFFYFGKRFTVQNFQLVPPLCMYMNSHAAFETTFDNIDFHISPLASVEELTTTHSPEYIQRFLDGEQTEQEQRNVGFPWSQEGVKRALSSVGGTLAAACDACEEWRGRMDSDAGDRQDKNRLATFAPWAAHVAGGTHHSFYDRGEGFSVFSDIAVAANVVLDRYSDIIKRILIVVSLVHSLRQLFRISLTSLMVLLPLKQDLDVHQGNGNAVLFQNCNEVVTFSMHCEANFFSEKQQSDLDIELPEGCSDQTYLATLNHWLKVIEKEAGSTFDMIFFQAGVDVLEEDRLGRMSLSLKGVTRRNELVYDFAHKLNIPLVICMGGGYPRTDDWTSIIDAHANVYFQAHRFLAKKSQPT